ncbi:hypothetical protein [Paenibacillus sp. CMAA1364]
MRKSLSTLSLLFLMLIFITNSATAATSNDSIVKRAESLYKPTLTKLSLDIIQGTNHKKHTYNSKYIPLKDLFNGYVDSLSWDGKKKTVVVKNEGSELIFNFSNNKMTESSNQIVIPSDWIRLTNGTSEINASVITYIFDRYGEPGKDLERDDWKEKLNFLDIKEMDGLSGISDGYLHVGVAYNKK